MISDEISFDHQANDHRQEDLLRQHCAGIDELIRSAGTKEEAERIVSETCSRFDYSCESDVLRSLLRKHVHTLFEGAWNHRP